MATHSESLRTETSGLNKLSVASLVLAVVALSGLWFLGVSSLAVFAVGAGHISLNQIRTQGGRGRRLATAALAIGYAIAALALFSSLTAIPAMIQS
jgi:hypothetical protein